MRQGDFQEFSAMLTDAMAFYGKDVSKFAIGVWWQACSRYSLEQVAKALTSHAMNPDNGQFAPKPADIVRALEGTHTDKALIAWGKALDAAGRVGAYQDAVFDDAAIHAVIEDMGGWPKFCRAETADLGYMQHRFCESYRAYAGNGVFAYPRVLAGDRSPDHVYTSRGLPPPKPVVVGDVVQALLVYRNGEQGGKTQLSIADMAAARVTAAIDAPEKVAA